MASELKLQLKADLTNGNLRDSFAPSGGQISVTQATALAYTKVVGLTTTAAALTLGVTTLGYLCLQNMDAAINIIYGPDSGGTQIDVGLLKPGEVAILRLQTGITLKAKSASGTPNLLVKIYND